MEDEWFATHLLLRASSELAEHALCISIEDEDGQFLLIEAADHLPDWITPEGVVNRVWIHDGHLHLVAASDLRKSLTKPSRFRGRSNWCATRPCSMTAPDDVEAAALACVRVSINSIESPPPYTRISTAPSRTGARGGATAHSQLRCRHPVARPAQLSLGISSRPLPTAHPTHIL